MLLLAGVLLPSYVKGLCQEYPYFVTYSQEMEEPGNLDIEMFNVVGNPQGGDSFLGSDVEFEYGLKGWWTTEFYLDGQSHPEPEHHLYRIPLGEPVPSFGP